MKIIFFSHDESIERLAKTFQNIEWSYCGEIDELMFEVDQSKDEDLLIVLLDFALTVKKIDKFSKKYLKDTSILRLGLADSEELKNIRKHQKSKLACANYLLKPIDAKTLVNAVNDYLMMRYIVENDLTDEGDEVSFSPSFFIETRPNRELAALDEEKEDYDTTQSQVVLPDDFKQMKLESSVDDENDEVFEAQEFNYATEVRSLIDKHRGGASGLHYKDDPVNEKIQMRFDAVFGESSPFKLQESTSSLSFGSYDIGEPKELEKTKKIEIDDDQEEEGAAQASITVNFSTDENASDDESETKAELNMKKKNTEQTEDGLEFSLPDEGTSDDLGIITGSSRDEDESTLEEDSGLTFSMGDDEEEEALSPVEDELDFSLEEESSSDEMTNEDILSFSTPDDDEDDVPVTGETTSDHLERTISQIVQGSIVEEDTGEFDISTMLESKDEQEEGIIEATTTSDDILEQALDDMENHSEKTAQTVIAPRPMPIMAEAKKEEEIIEEEEDQLTALFQTPKEPTSGGFNIEDEITREDISFDSPQNQDMTQTKGTVLAPFPQSNGSLSSLPNDELLRLQTTIRQLRQEREEALKEISELKKEMKLNEQASIGGRAELEEARIEISILKKRHAQEIQELRYQYQLSEEKKQIFEERCKHYQKEFDRLNQKVRLEFNQVKQREKELESQLELVSMDTEAQVRSRDSKILELKRKIDALEFNMENATIREQKSRDDKVKIEERMLKIMGTLRGSIKLLEEDIDLENDLNMTSKEEPKQD